MSNEKFITNDKRYAPFLLACSIQGQLKFEAEHTETSLVFWEFSPHDKAKELISKFEHKNSVGIPEKDIFEATEYFWRRVNEVRNGL